MRHNRSERNFFGTAARVEKRPGVFRVAVQRPPGGAYSRGADGSPNSIHFEFVNSDDRRVTPDMEPIKFK